MQDLDVPRADAGSIVPEVYNIAVTDIFDHFFVFGQLQGSDAAAHTCGGYRFENRHGFFAIDTARLVSTKRLGLNINLQC